jgi:hypothetical protein
MFDKMPTPTDDANGLSLLSIGIAGGLERQPIGING